MKTESGLQVPVINLNGTGKNSLMEEYKAAIQSVREAIKKVQAITVHGRDSYENLNKALDERVGYLINLKSMEKSLTEVAMAIMDQGK